MPSYILALDLWNFLGNILLKLCTQCFSANFFMNPSTKTYKYVEIKQSFKVDIKQNISTDILIIKFLFYQWDPHQSEYCASEIYCYIYSLWLALIISPRLENVNTNCIYWKMYCKLIRKKFMFCTCNSVC